ncbi:MAG: M4 family metallopeptidase [bacterium]|nr:M4 family metallopeptidase [bacterium]
MKIKQYAFSVLLIPILLSAQTPNKLDLRTKRTNVENNFINSIPVIDGKKTANFVSSIRSLPAVNTVAIEVDLRQTEISRIAVANTAQAMEKAYSFLLTNKQLVHPLFNANQLSVYNSELDNLGQSHVKMQQYYGGIEVSGYEIFVHFLGSETYSHGLWANIPVGFNTVPTISKEEAVNKALMAIQPDFGFTVLNSQQKAILKYSLPEIKTIISIENNMAILCYEIMVRPNGIERWIAIVNAKTGDIVKQYNNTCHVDGPKTGTGNDLNAVQRTINSYQISSNFYLIDATKSMYNASQSSLPDDPSGAIWTLDANNTPATSFNNITSTSVNFSNTKAVSAHYNSGVAYEYYKTTFNRNSINGSGGTIISVINVSDASGNGLDNAYWNGQFMAYGNGKTVFKPLAGGLDVAGHEMTHGVVQNTANLEYNGQSGAINESMADIFGCMMDRADWKMGEDIVKPGFYAGGALRDIQDPHNGGNSLSDNGYQPKKMSEYYSGTQDNGGVHINSGIPNYAFYLFATATTKEKAEQVYYRALTTYLTKSSQFKDLRLAVVQACKDLYTNTEAAAAADAFDAVEIYGPPVSGGGGGGNIGNNVADLPANPGADFLLYSDEDPNSPYTITKATLSSGTIAGQITHYTKRKPSVVDDGSYCIYVGDDNKIYSLLLDGSKTETVLQSQAIWANVAISKDGKRLAAITTNTDTSIYIYDFGKASWQSFKLYNPTFSGVNSGGVLYADALEWDHTGTKVMYDAKSLINNQNGSDYSYWDVGILDVWNLETNNWSDGSIEKLFSSLPDGISIGNPVFSQRSPYIVAFDYVDGNNNQVIVTGYNLNTNKIGTVFTGTELGFPSYSRTDNILIFNALNTNNDLVVAQKALSADKITVSGTATVLVSLAKWGVWYANGTRSLLFNSKDILTFGFEGLNPQVIATINGTNITCTVPGTVNVAALTPSFTNSPYSYVRIGGTKQTSAVNNNNFTNTLVYTVVAQDGSTKNYNVTVQKTVVGIQTDKKNLGINLFPNPAIDEVLLKASKPMQTIFVYDIQGRLIKEINANNNTSFAIDIQSLQSGMYIMTVKTAEGEALIRFTKS